mmetsp:Transcript_48745/g.137784  ORF Transcript_48745/g.137784 Transcript_48745/m.137784 type:complete len:284 (-) Transcript_48745:305-1156(-)
MAMRRVIGTALRHAAAATPRGLGPAAPAAPAAMLRRAHQQVPRGVRAGGDGFVDPQWEGEPAAQEETSGSGADAGPGYTSEDIAAWRADFGFARQQHSLAQIGYTDEELLEWRRPFDAVAQDNRISFPAFERFVAEKYSGVIPDDQLAQKVRRFWDMFDVDNSNYIDFGEFIGAGILFDVDWTREKIRKQGVEATFTQYAEEEFMLEHQFYELMLDFQFFVVTETDARGFMLAVDNDKDGLVSLEDFVQWAENDELPTIKKFKSKKFQKTVPQPPGDDDSDDD